MPNSILTPRTPCALCSVETFHEHKDILIELNVRDHLTIPELHSLVYDVDSIMSPHCLEAPPTKAYPTSNKRDYTERMARWLQRQEATLMRSSYISWRRFPLSVTTILILIPKTDDESDGQVSCPISSPIGRSATIYHVAKDPPMKNLSLTDPETQFGAVDFLPAFMTFLSARSPKLYIKPSQYDRYDAFKQITITLPGSAKRTNRIRATPMKPSSGQKPAVPSRFDTALIVEDPSQYCNAFCLDGLRVCQIHVIFNLPPQFGHFHHRRNAAIVSVQSIIRTCHLTPKSSFRIIDSSWNTNNVLDRVDIF
ncbi:hypothetical protein MVEN_00147200 [Mycena venus]|uniref:Uncharacterized protein n=1 Tax=Mycena venus TaxID=2733690 RepID=A0A8H7DDM6_9AGAR|nr:hypothetical protein MVEN_00147200 [Mycena venus]